MTTESKHTPTPWVVSQSASCDARIESPSNETNWCLTGISCHPQFNGSGKTHGPSILVSQKEAQANAAFIVKACNQYDALVKIAEAAKESISIGECSEGGFHEESSCSACSAKEELNLALAAYQSLTEAGE